MQQFGWWSVFVPHRADPTLGTFPADTTPAARAAAAIDATLDDSQSGDDESSVEISDDSGRSSALFDGPAARAAMRAADQRGADVAANRVRAARIPTSLPNEAFCRVYDCENIFDAWTVWAIALLHIRSGVVDHTDISRFLCSLFRWPHPRDDSASHQ